MTGRPVPIPFCGQAYADRTLDANAQECVNLYPMRSPTPEAPERVVMYPTPGYIPYRSYWYLDGNDFARGVRGLFTINSDLYMVYGPYLLKVESPFAAPDPVGTLNTTEGLVDIQCNTVELVISDDQFGYTYNLGTGTFSVISGGSFPAEGVTNFVYIDGYVLAAVNGSKRVIQSDLLAAGTFPALAFADVTSFPDDLVALYSDQNSVYLFGPKLTEVRFNAGTIPFAFEKVPGVLIQAGCGAKRTIRKFGNSIAWLATDEEGSAAYVATLKGYTPVPLSTPPVNEAIQRYTTVSDAFAYTYREADNTFYCITFPTEGVTWACEEKTGWWHRRSVAGGADLPTCFASWQGKNFIGTADGGLCEMSQDYPSAVWDKLGGADGTGSGGNFLFDPLRRVRSGPHLWADDQPIFLHELRIDMEHGKPFASGGVIVSNAPPLATLEISRDGGHTWVSAGIAALGNTGEYKKRLTWRKLGRALKYTFRFTMSDTARTYITGASAKITVGAK